MDSYTGTPNSYSYLDDFSYPTNLLINQSLNQSKYLSYYMTIQYSDKVLYSNFLGWPNVDDYTDYTENINLQSCKKKDTQSRFSVCLVVACVGESLWLPFFILY